MGRAGGPERIAIVGASLAGIRAATALREEGFSGSITMIGEEPHSPYDRPPLSKQFLAGKWDEPRIALVAADKIDGLNLDLRLGRRAVALDPDAHLVELDDGAQVEFDKAIVATGAHPRKLPTAAAPSVMTLRTLDDSRKLASLLGARTRLVVVGAGFIGSEVAATATGLGAQVTVLEVLDVPLARVLGVEVGAACTALHRRHGVEVRTGTAVTGVTEDGTCALVTLDDGGVIEADVVVVGIGVVPTVEWLEGSGLATDDGLIVDTYLYATDDVLAAGDVARWPDPRSGATFRAEHWTNAAEQGAVAGHNLLAGRKDAEPYVPVPYIWSDQYDVKIQVLGNPRPDDTVEVVDGSVDEGRFVALYGRGQKLAAAVGFGRPRQLMGFRPLIVDGATFDQAVSLLSG